MLIVSSDLSVKQNLIMLIVSLDPMKVHDIFMNNSTINKAMNQGNINKAMKLIKAIYNV